MRKNVLLVLQDRQESHDLFKNLETAYNVFVAGSREEAFRLFTHISFHLIICRAGMPEPDGWQLCAQFKSSPAYAHIPVILVSNDHSLAARMKCLEAGADAFIGLPVSSEYLEAQVHNLIVNRAKVAEYFALSHVETRGNCDEDFIKKLNSLIVGNLHNQSLHVDLLARLMNMSRPTLYRKIKTITDCTPNELINQARLKQAAALLASGGYRVFEIARMVGFQTQSSFGKAFIKQFRLTPTQYLHMKR